MSDTVTMKPEQPRYSKKQVGLMIFAIVTCMILTGISGYKLLPMQSAIMEHFHIAESAYGYLNTSASWVSVACSIPCGFLVRKLRCNVTVLLGYSVAVGGILVQVFAPNFVIFVIGRMLEGAGSAFAGLVTWALILNLTNRSHVSFWSSFMTMVSVLPQIIMTKGGTTLMVNSGLTFQQLFLIVCGIYGVAAAIWVILVPFSLRIYGIGSSQKPTREQTLRVMKNKSAMLIAFAMIFFNATSMTFTAYIIKFLTTKGMTQMQAADTYSITTILGLASMIAFGLLSDKLKTRRKIAIMSFVAGAVAFVVLGVVPANMIWLYVVLWGTLPRSISGMTSATATDIAELPSDVPIINSVRSTIAQVGSIVIGILMGYGIQYLGYQAMVFILAGGMLVGAVLWFFAKQVK